MLKLTGGTRPAGQDVGRSYLALRGKGSEIQFLTPGELVLGGPPQLLFLKVGHTELPTPTSNSAFTGGLHKGPISWPNERSELQMPPPVNKYALV